MISLSGLLMKTVIAPPVRITPGKSIFSMQTCHVVPTVWCTRIDTYTKTYGTIPWRSFNLDKTNSNTWSSLLIKIPYHTFLWNGYFWNSDSWYSWDRWGVLSFFGLEHSWTARYYIRLAGDVQERYCGYRSPRTFLFFVKNFFINAFGLCHQKLIIVIKPFPIKNLIFRIVLRIRLGDKVANLTLFFSGRTSTQWWQKKPQPVIWSQCTTLHTSSTLWNRQGILYWNLPDPHRLNINSFNASISFPTTFKTKLDYTPSVCLKNEEDIVRILCCLK